MQVSVEKSGTLERRLTVEVPGAELQERIDARLREIGRQVKIKGFRPGKIPFKVLRQRYGRSVQQEIVTQAVQTSLLEAIEKERLRPASSPVLEGTPDLEAGGDLRYTASIEVYPDLDAIDTTGINLKRPVAEVADADVDNMLQTLREQRQTWSDLDQAPGEGHRATVEYVAQTDAGRVPEVGRQRLAIIMGQSGFDTLEETIAPLEPGGEAQVKLRFPDDYGERDLAGRKAVVEVKLASVQERHLPEIDAEFIRSFSVESGDIEDLRTEVRSNLERELAQAMNSVLKSQLVEQLLELKADLDVPASAVREEAAGLAGRAAAQVGGKPDLENLEPFMDSARRRVRSGLLLAEIARQNNIMIDGARVRKAVEAIAETYEQPREVVQLYYSDERLLKAVENSVLEEQVVDWVLDHAKVTDEPMGFQEVINAATAAGKVL
jgi:trigger factor